MGHFKSPNFVGTLSFYLVLLQAKSSTFFPMPALNRNEKVKCEDSGKEYRRDNAARHRKSSVRAVISCPESNYCTYNQQEMNYHAAEKHAPSTSKQSTVCSSYQQEFPSY